MSTDTDRVIANIDRVLTSDEITDLVDEQLARYDERSGYDYDVNQPEPCAHCHRPEHGLAITERIEHMRLWGAYDETYRYDEDTTPILCPGTYVPGPVGFRHAHERAQRARGAVFWYDHDAARELTPIGTLLHGGRVMVGPHTAPVFSFNTEAMEELREQWRREAERHEARMARFSRALSAATETIRAGAPYWTFTVGDTGPWEITRPPATQPAGALTVRLIDPDGRPIPLARHVRAHHVEPTDTGFTVELDLPPRGRRAAVRDRGPGSRIILEGRGGARERIAGTVTGICLTDDATRFEVTVTSEHHHLPNMYTDPTEN